ncbi:N-formylglutamate deformylase [Brenneria goodwinii]|uniref:N-formylglutamate deformylase n=1 Tax=Brenneria goodwinii TaxID=1109412 RepID=A0AAE8EVG5_9GAMM|nr:N-formylglutamate deformylase [Brenneria goodwinii]RLM28617.1 N-formylglutamate deformylase [Brenneria goodwinii]
MTPSIFTLRQGHAPLLISIPHCGEYLPPELAARLSPQARRVPDTDWHLPRLYELAAGLGASVLQANYSRYVIDLNRSCDGSNLYPGQHTTTLCPTFTFHDEPIYADPADEPDEVEIATRIEQYWKPYHTALQEEIARLVAQHGRVLVWEAHSIESELPMLFEGVLPTLNLGNNGGLSCVPEILAATEAVARGSGLTWSANGRFKGGYITRHYADPAHGVHLLQLEMGRCAYMDESEPWNWRDEPAERTRKMLRRMMDAALAALPERSGEGLRDLGMIRRLAREQRRLGIGQVEIGSQGERLKICMGMAQSSAPAAAVAHGFTLRASTLGVLEAGEAPVRAGDRVAAGQVLAHVLLDDRRVAVPAPLAGRIAEVLVAPGARVDYGMALFTLLPEED